MGSAEAEPVTDGTIEKLPESPEKTAVNGEVVVQVVDKEETEAVPEKVEGQTELEESKEENDKSIEKSEEKTEEKKEEKKEKKVKKKKSFRSFSFLRKKKEIKVES